MKIVFKTGSAARRGLAGQPLRCAASLLTLALFVFSSLPAYGRTLEEYGEEVAHLREDFSALISTPASESSEETERFEGEVFAEVREFAGDTDTVIFNGSELVPDNHWLLERVNELTAGTRSEEDRKTILLAIYERLGAIEARILELRSAQAAAQSKDENKRRLAEILSREEFKGKPESGDRSVAARFLKWVEDWFRRMFPPPEPRPQTSPSAITAGLVVQILVYIATAVLLAYLAFRFLPVILRRWRGDKGKKKKKRDRVVLGEKIEAGKTTDDLFAEAEELVRAGKLREGVRKGYIALLFGLGEKRIIGLAHHKTNRDYLHDLEKKRELHGIVSGLTNQFERHWYGSIEAEEKDWRAFSAGFTEAFTSAKK